MICAHIKSENNSELVLAALTHDLHESELGDIPYPAKRNLPNLNAACDEQETKFAMEQNLPILNAEDAKMLKWADMMELVMWCKREAKLGNVNIELSLANGINALVFMGHPNEKARDLFYEVING